MLRRSALGSLLAASSSLAAALVACSNSYPGPLVPLDAGPPGNVGDACDEVHVCRTGLACDTGQCIPGHSSADGTPCIISAECKNGSYCGPARTCAPAGQGKEGELCASDSDCVSGLRCNLSGFAGKCQKDGTVDIGGKCTSNADCFSGLGCADGTCTPLPPNPNGKPPIGLITWKGETCADDAGPTKAYFRVPRGTGDGDFYRLPFPNDVRKKNGKLDLSGHPTPGAAVLGFDPLDRYLRDLEQNADGFSEYPTVFFRFSAGVDFESLKQNGVVRLVDITPNGSGSDVGHGWTANTARNNYLCANWLALRPPFAGPLQPGNTYAAIMTTAVLDAKKVPVARSDDMTAMLGATPPPDPVLALAWGAYAPLRAWATAKMFDPMTILTAAVFTVGHHERTASKLPAAVLAATAPAATGWVKCGAGPSPCPQATGNRACGAPDPAFDELHALVSVPIFQKGTAPYLAPADGGGFDLAVDGTPQLVRTEQVCMALTVPKGAMPGAGWPLAVYAHGTDGSFRSHVTDGVAARLASVDDGLGGKTAMAVLGIDQVEHGPRRGASSEFPSVLFYNYGNPAAARGNPLQGAADQLSLVRFARALNLTAMQSPTGSAIKFDRVLFWGHSQGATAGSVGLPYGDVPAVVLSGEGASLMDALLTKKKPVDVSSILPVVFQDASIDGNHPVPALLQNALDPADPLDHAAAMTMVPPLGVLSKHVFQPFAQGDTYSPPITQLTYAFAAALGVAAPPASVTMQDPILMSAGYKPVPVSGNAIVKTKPYTAALREYPPGIADGHFVAFGDADAKADVDRFLAEASKGIVPHVGK